MTRNRGWITRTGMAGVLALASLGLAGCGDDTGAEVEVEDIQEAGESPSVAPSPTAPPVGKGGIYNQQFLEGMNTMEGQEATVSAEVDEVVSEAAFTIVDPDDAAVAPLPVIHDQDLAELEPGRTVRVTGTVHTVFDLPQVEQSLGIDLDDPVYEDWDKEPYLEASEVWLNIGSG